ncbi:hypothetical protein ACSBR2_020658 [Camellia fascicularis]
MPKPNIPLILNFSSPCNALKRRTVCDRASSELRYSLQTLRKRQEAMISVLAQERLLGAALGSMFTGIVVFEQRRRIYKSISDTQSQFTTYSQMGEPIFEKRSRLDIAHLWNKAVDQTLGPVIESLSSRGW